MKKKLPTRDRKQDGANISSKDGAKLNASSHALRGKRGLKSKKVVKGIAFNKGLILILIPCTVFVVAILVANSSAIGLIRKTLDQRPPQEGNGDEVAQEAKTIHLNTESADFNVSRGIERRSNLSLQEFIDLYDAKWPVLITDALKHWPALKKWNKDFFVKNYGTKKISFKGVHGDLSNKQGLSSDLRIFLQHVHESSPNTWTYLEDELFLMTHAELRADVKTPVYLKEDFFSLLPDELRPWNAMLLWGTKYSRSTLHIDPYNWTGTNAVLKGLKSWKLYPPGQDHLLYAFANEKSGFPLECQKYQSKIDAFSFNPKEFPLATKAKAVEFVQYPGELLIIPTGWFHQAFNLEETMAVSSQVMNSQNYKKVLHEILKVGNIKKKDIPNDLESLPPEEQVKKIFAKIPQRIIDKGRHVTRDILQKLKQGANSKIYFA